ncbi:MAG TPA: serine/threonine-protein kinase [Natronosporangium sp.]
MPVTAGLLLLLTGTPAAAQEPAPGSGPSCAATGFLVSSEDELSTQRAELAEQPVQQLAGVPLVDGQTWVIPDGSQPVVVVVSDQPLAGGTVSVAMAGQRFEADSVNYDQPQDRFVTSVWLPHLGPTTRTLGLVVASPPCELAVTLSVDRSVWSTLVGIVAIIAAALFGLLTVLIARLRKGGWLRRFLFAAPFGLLAGLAQGAVLLEAGTVGPFDTPPWWAPVIGLVLAALLPLTRFRRRRQPAPPLPPAPLTVPVGAPVDGYQVEGVFTATEVAAVFRASRPDGDRALLKVLRPERYQDPVARLRLEREARALSGWEHPNVLRLRQTLANPAGPPTLVFEHVDGAPLRQLLLDGGKLSGPQAVNLVVSVLSGLRVLHERELVHRDIRPEQVWLDTGGRVLLAGFELTATGVEHATSPIGAVPYASPEQRAGGMIDGRADLYACGILLAELLTGRPAPPAPGELPEPLAAVLARALADDPAGRPGSARELSAELFAAAEQAYGADWLARGALAGALVAHGALGAAVAGYTLGGGAGAAGGAGIVAGLGAAGTGGLTAAGTTAGFGTGVTAAMGTAPATGHLSAAAAQVTPVAPAGAAASTGGPAGAVVNAGVAVVTGIAVVAGAVLVGSEPAEAQEVVVTPDQARLIFVRTTDEARDGVDDHLGDGVREMVDLLLDEHASIADGPLTEVVVGVPPDQFDYPAWFVATGQIGFDEGVAYLSARFDRASDAEPWLMTALAWSTETALAPPALDEDGWLPPAAPTELAIDPAALPQRYADWLEASWEAHAVVDDDLLTPRHQDAFVAFTAENAAELAADGWLDQRMSIRVEVVPDPEPPVVIPLADGGVLVSFRAVREDASYNRPGFTTGPCGTEPYADWFYDDEDGPRYQMLTVELDLVVFAWVPPAGDGAVVAVEDWATSYRRVDDQSTLC